MQWNGMEWDVSFECCNRIKLHLRERDTRALTVSEEEHRHESIVMET